MGSFVSQLAMVADIWRDEVGSYAPFFEKMYRKIYQEEENSRKDGQTHNIFVDPCYEHIFKVS